MKTVASALLGIATSVGACVAAVSVASAVGPMPEQIKTAAMGEPDLWTPVPIHVDRAAQNYPRISPVYSTYITNAPLMPVANRAADTNMPAADDGVGETPDLASEHINWCAQRYKSYDVSADSYVGFSGHARKCRQPSQSKGVDDVMADVAAKSSVDANAASWCTARYRSYRSEDNTYRSFSGQRRQCQFPRGDDLASAEN